MSYAGSAAPASSTITPKPIGGTILPPPPAPRPPTQVPRIRPSAWKGSKPKPSTSNEDANDRSSQSQSSSPNRPDSEGEMAHSTKEEKSTTSSISSYSTSTMITKGGPTNSIEQTQLHGIARLPSASLFSKSLGNASGESSPLNSLPVASSRPQSARRQHALLQGGTMYSHVHFVQLLTQRISDESSPEETGAAERTLSDILAKDSATIQSVIDKLLEATATPIAQTIKELFYPQEDSDTLIAIKQLSAQSSSSKSKASLDRLFMLLSLAAVGSLGAAAYPHPYSPLDNNTKLNSSEALVDELNQCMKTLKNGSNDASAVAPFLSIITLFPTLVHLNQQLKDSHGITSLASSQSDQNALNEALNKALEQRVQEVEDQLKLFFNETGHSAPKRYTQKRSHHGGGVYSHRNSWNGRAEDVQEVEMEEDMLTLDERLEEIASNLDYLRDSVMKQLGEEDQDQRLLAEQLASSLATARKELEEYRRAGSPPISQKSMENEKTSSNNQNEELCTKLKEKIDELEAKLAKESESKWSTYTTLEHERSLRSALEAKVESLTAALKEEKLKAKDIASKQYDDTVRMEKRHELNLQHLREEQKQLEMALNSQKSTNASLQSRLGDLESSSPSKSGLYESHADGSLTNAPSPAGLFEELISTERKSGRIPSDLVAQLTKIHTLLFEQESNVMELKSKASMLHQLESRLAFTEEMLRDREEFARTEQKRFEDGLETLRIKVDEVSQTFSSLLPKSKKLDHVAPSALDDMTQTIHEAFALENKLMRDAFTKRISKLETEKQMVVAEYAKQMRKMKQL